MTTYLTLWTCLCSDVATDPATFPETCPCHGKRAAVPPVREDPKYAPMALGHRCPPRAELHAARARTQGEPDPRPTAEEAL